MLLRTYEEIPSFFQGKGVYRGLGSLRVSKPQRVRIGSRIKLIIASDPVAAGFPSPAENYLEQSIELDKWLVKNKLATFLVLLDFFEKGSSAYGLVTLALKIPELFATVSNAIGNHITSLIASCFTQMFTIHIAFIFNQPQAQALKLRR
jgi:hypothetical protein